MPEEYEEVRSVSKLPKQQREMSFIPDTLNEEARTVEISWGTGAPVTRGYWERYVETLDMSEKAVNMERMNSGSAGLFTDHRTSLDNQIGVVESSRVDGKEGISVVRFSKNERAERIFQDVKDGIIRNASIGYRVNKVKRTRASKEGELDQVRVVDWTPHELSLVGVGADAGAGTRSSTESEENDVEVISEVAKAETRELPPEHSHEEETVMPNEAGNTGSEIDEVKIRSEALAAAKAEEKARYAGIRSLCTKHNIEDSDFDKLITEDKSIEQAREFILDKLATQSEDDRQSSKASIKVTKNEHDDMIRGMTEAASEFALANNGLVYEAKKENREIADKYASSCRSITGMARTIVGELVGYKEAAGLSNSDLIERALHVSDHFPTLIANIANKSLEAAYNEIPQTWMPLADIVSVSDFKTNTAIRLSEAPNLERTDEHSEFKRGTINESSETYKILTYGKIMGLSRQLLINDDLGGLAKVPAFFGAAVARLESDLFWALVAANPTMNEDGLAVFHASHGNLGTAGILSETTLSEARKNMRTQRGLKQRDGSASQARLNIASRYLIVSPTYETLAEKIMETVTPEQTANVNVFSRSQQIIVEPRLLDSDAGGGAGNQWYNWAAQSAGVERVKASYLNGNRRPFLDQQTGFNTDGVEFKVRHDVGFDFADFRGVHLNPGA